MRKNIIIFIFALGVIFNDCYSQGPAFDWVVGVGSDTNDVGSSVVVDTQGNCYVTGSFRNTADFDPGPDTSYLTSNGQGDIFIQKFNSEGDHIWAVSVGGSLSDYSVKIDLNIKGNIVITGGFRGKVDFDPGPDTAYLIGGGTYILEIDTSGSYVWACTFEQSSYSNPTDFCFDAEGGRYLIGFFNDTIDFDPGPGVFELTVDGPQNWGDIFIQKMDSANNFVWAKKIAGDHHQYSTNIEIDPNNNIIINGHFAGTTDFDPGPNTYYLTSCTPWPYDYFLLKLDSDGNFQWAFSLGSTTADYGNALSVDNAGNIYSCGKFGDSIDFDPGPGEHYITAIDWDMFIQKLDPNGNFLWAKSFGYSPAHLIKGSAVDEFGNIYSIGHYLGTMDFDPGPGIFELESYGLWDIFIQKLDSSGDFCWANAFGGKDFDDCRDIRLSDDDAIFLTGYFQDTAWFNGIPESRLISNGKKDIFLLKLDTSDNAPYISYQNICFGDTTFFNINPFSSAQTVLWDFGDTASGVNNTSTLPSPGHLFTSPGLFTVSATVVEGTSSSVVSCIVSISAGPASGVFIAGTDSICQGQSNVLYAISSIDEADSIIWNLIPDSAGTIVGNDTIIYINFSSSYYGLAVLSACGANECGTGDSALYNIDVIGYPLSEAGPSALICEDENHNLSGSAINHSISVWTTNGDGEFDDPFMLDATYSPGPVDIANGDVYLVLYAFAISPCINVDADTMLLTIKSLPNNPLTPIGPTNILIEPGLTSSYYINSVLNANDYLWHLNPPVSGVISGIDTTAVVSWNNNYTGSMAFINVEALNECGMLGSDTLLINLSPVELSETSWLNEQISIRPNPSDGIFNIEISSDVGLVDLTVLNSAGIKIRQYKINFSGVDNSFKLDLRNQLSGIYYLQFSGDDSVLVKKVLVNHIH